MDREALYKKVFPHGIGASNPINSTPFEVSLSDFAFAYGSKSQRRKALFEDLLDCIEWHLGMGCHIEFMLIGGSYVSDKTAPRDVDGIFFYRLEDGVSLSPSHREIQLRKWQTLDVRHCPIDSDPFIICRLSSYFTLLYSVNTNGNNNVLNPVFLIRDLHRK